MSCPAQNINVADSVSDPMSSKACIVVFCERTTLGCTMNADVEFYDR